MDHINLVFLTFIFYKLYILLFNILVRRLFQFSFLGYPLYVAWVEIYLLCLPADNLSNIFSVSIEISANVFCLFGCISPSFTFFSFFFVYFKALRFEIGLCLFSFLLWSWSFFGFSMIFCFFFDFSTFFKDEMDGLILGLKVHYLSSWIYFSILFFPISYYFLMWFKMSKSSMVKYPSSNLIFTFCFSINCSTYSCVFILKDWANLLELFSVFGAKDIRGGEIFILFFFILSW